VKNTERHMLKFRVMA